MAECDEVMVENSLSRYGLRTLSVMRMGGPVNLERWLDLSPAVCRESVQAWRNEERELGVHHLSLFWPAREVTRLVYPDDLRQVDGVFWWIGKSMYEPEKTASIREAADWASMTYQIAFQRWPTRCLIGKIRAGWKMKGGDSFEMEGDGQAVPLMLLEELWVPKGFLVIT